MAKSKIQSYLDKLLVCEFCEWNQTPLDKPVQEMLIAKREHLENNHKEKIKCF